jgi:uncharacterized RmlC-like cupin family protein
MKAAFTPFVYPDGVALGGRRRSCNWTTAMTGCLGEGFHVYRMPPGMTTRGHRHNGHEQFLILEGELHESDGTASFGAGDMVFYRDGTEHNSYTPNGCLLAVHIVAGFRNPGGELRPQSKAAPDRSEAHR